MRESVAERRTSLFFIHIMSVQNFLSFFLFPQSRQEDVKRQEFILNVFLFSILLLLSAGLITNRINRFFFSDPATYQNNALSFFVLVLLFLFFCSLLFLSRRGLIRIASYILLGSLFSLSVYIQFQWGVDLPASILLHVITIVMAGILISTRFAFFTTTLVVGAITLVGLLHEYGIVSVNRYWAAQGWVLTDIIIASVLFLIIAIVSWLSNREIEKSLRRARTSEAALKEERDLLEVRVKERTEELRKAELERISQSYRFVEFGRLASGLFHDLVNPLTALSLNIQSIARARGKEQNAKLSTLAEDVERAQQATAHMQQLVHSLRRHLAREGVREEFSCNRILGEVAQVLAPYARARSVALRTDAPDEVRTHGDAVALTQALTNLISNAVDSYASVERDREKRDVWIELFEEKKTATIRVRDFGSGMSEDVLENIFEPFFTTKESADGLGIGLALSKRLVEKEFGGSLSVQSRVGEGSVFTIQFPVREP